MNNLKCDNILKLSPHVANDFPTTKDLSLNASLIRITYPEEIKDESGERREVWGSVCGSIIAVHLATHALISTYPLVCTEHAKKRKKKPVTILEWILMSPHFHQRLCLTALNNHYEDSLSPQASSTEPPGLRSVLVVSIMKTPTLRGVYKGGWVDEQLLDTGSGTCWLQEAFFPSAIHVIDYLVSRRPTQRKREVKKRNAREKFRAASSLQIRTGNWKKW